ncbi:hypothetical protein BDV95DRAFT_657345 [Massariosphaeria phaeospora]|uniref:Uncharacterized protein n=1 Tax=Massariosphaeria phaeospora TaxID=100035 RepID=A0A7C8IDF8_9PLEO|nr:hypothetical protein BDV95DRAFT_657345 [Massariosphaeria phaeospora]
MLHFVCLLLSIQFKGSVAIANSSSSVQSSQDESISSAFSSPDASAASGKPCCYVEPNRVGLGEWYNKTVTATVATVVTQYLEYDDTTVTTLTTYYNTNATNTESLDMPTNLVHEGVETQYIRTTVVFGDNIVTQSITLASPTPFVTVHLVDYGTAHETVNAYGTNCGNPHVDRTVLSSLEVDILLHTSGWWDRTQYVSLGQEFMGMLVTQLEAKGTTIPGLESCTVEEGEGAPTVHVPVNALTEHSETTTQMPGAFAKSTGDLSEESNPATQVPTSTAKPVPQPSHSPAETPHASSLSSAPPVVQPVELHLTPQESSGQAAPSHQDVSSPNQIVQSTSAASGTSGPSEPSSAMKAVTSLQETSSPIVPTQVPSPNADDIQSYNSIHVPEVIDSSQRFLEPSELPFHFAEVHVSVTTANTSGIPTTPEQKPTLYTTKIQSYNTNHVLEVTDSSQAFLEPSKLPFHFAEVHISVSTAYTSGTSAAPQQEQNLQMTKVQSYPTNHASEATDSSQKFLRPSELPLNFAELHISVSAAYVSGISTAPDQKPALFTTTIPRDVPRPATSDGHPAPNLDVLTNGLHNIEGTDVPAIATPRPPHPPSTIVIGTKTISLSYPSTEPGVIFPGTATLSPGSILTYSGDIFSLNSVGSALIVFASTAAPSTIPLYNTAENTGLPVATTSISAAPYTLFHPTASGGGIVLPNGEILLPGSTTVLNETSWVLASSATELVVTIPLALATAGVINGTATTAQTGGGLGSYIWSGIGGGSPTSPPANFTGGVPARVGPLGDFWFLVWGAVVGGLVW